MVLARRLGVAAHYAAMSVLDWRTGGTSDAFRSVPGGIPFGEGFDLCRSCSTVGGSTSTSGQESVA